MTYTQTYLETLPPPPGTTRPATGPRAAHRAQRPRVRPGGAPLRYRGSAVPLSRAGHRRPPVSAGATVGVALLAALVTVWMGVVAHFGALAAAPGGPVPEQLGVVRVQAGENLHQLAARVAPDAPTGQVVSRIRELNGLDSVALDAGQTLIAPIG